MPIEIIEPTEEERRNLLKHMERLRDIGWAVGAMRQGFKVCREDWNGKGMWLQLQVPDVDSKMTLSYVYLTTPTGHRVPWTCSQADLLGYDWRLVE